MVPKPVKAVLMLFPITDATEAAKASEEERLKATGQKLSPDLWFSKQTISNACGTVAMLHAYANNPDVEPAAGSFLEKYLKATKDMSPEERARFLEYPKEGEPDIEAAHSEAAQDGQSAPPPDEEQVRQYEDCLFVKLEIMTKLALEFAKAKFAAETMQQVCSAQYTKLVQA